MARIVAGIGCSHAPSIAHAYDQRLAAHPDWKPLFDAFARLRAWLWQQQPEVLVVVYNDHIDQYFLDAWPTFGIGVAEAFAVADEGWGPRPLPPVPGHQPLAKHLATSLVHAGFDLTVCHRMVLDHGVLSPLPLLAGEGEEEGFQPAVRRWRVPVVPLTVNVVFEPLPTPARCWALGEALGRAIAAYPGELRVGVIGTGGLSHQLTGPNFGRVYPEWDRTFLELLEREPHTLASYSMQELARLGGDQGVEVVQWLVMRAALPSAARAELRFYYPHALMGYGLLAFRG